MTAKERDILERFEEKLDKVVVDVEKMKACMIGDEFHKGGIIEEVKKLKKQMLNRVVESWTVRAVGLIIVGVAAFWKNIIEILT